MKTALFFFKVPDRDSINSEQIIAARALLTACKKATAEYPTLKKLGEFGWILPLDIHTPTLAALIAIAKTSIFTYQVAYLDGVDWFEYDPRPLQTQPYKTS